MDRSLEMLALCKYVCVSVRVECSVLERRVIVCGRFLVGFTIYKMGRSLRFVSVSFEDGRFRFIKAILFFRV